MAEKRRLVLGGLMFGDVVKAYLVLALLLGVPGAMAGLVCSLIGLLIRKANRPLALAGVLMAGLQLLLLIPASMLHFR